MHGPQGEIRILYYTTACMHACINKSPGVDGHAAAPTPEPHLPLTTMTLRVQDYYGAAVLSVGTALLLHSAYTLLTLPHGGQPPSREMQKQDASLPSSSSSSSSKNTSSFKFVSQSAVSNMTYTVTLEDCQIADWTRKIRPKVRAGSLLKLIDVAAGIAARRHADMPCVTISVDSVLFLKPIFLGDLIHLSASVNRAWGSSMEIGVKVMKTDEKGGPQEYVSHSYLTFVALKEASPDATKPKNGSGLLSSFGSLLDKYACVQQQPSKVNLPSIKASSRLEARRHLLAGRRRTKRIEDAQKGEARDGVSVKVKERVRQEVLNLLVERDDLEEETWQQTRLKAVEIEYVIRSLARQEDGIYIRDGRVVVDVPGDETFSYSEAEIRATARALGVRLPGDEVYEPARRLSIDFFNPPWVRNRSSSSAGDRKRLVGPPHSNLPVSSTLTKTMHLVFPQHTNSHSIIFGGNTMSWSEEVALMACRNLKIRGVDASNGTWKTVALDGLEFNVKVAVGELMILSALVVKTYSRSCEVYVLAQAESRGGERRFTNDALFTLALDHGKEEDVEIVSSIEMPSSSALETFASASTQRKQQRLELKNLLNRIYG